VLENMKRLGGILRMHTDAFDEIVFDKRAFLKAGAIVLLVAVLGSLRWSLSSASPWITFLGMAVSSWLGWYFFASSMGFLARLLWDMPVETRELLSVTGYSFLPLIFLSLPDVGWISIVWFLGVLYLGLRYIYMLTVPRTLLLIVIGSLVAFFVWGMANLLIAVIL
jgi:hypothetical protein